MPDLKTPEIQPSLINEPTVVPPVEKTPEQLLFPDPKGSDPKPAEPAKPGEPAATEPKTVEPKPESKEEAPEGEQAKPSTETKTVPVDYESLKLPEGSQLSQEELAAVKKEAKESGLTIEEAQGVVAKMNDTIKAFAQRQQQTWVNLRKEWKSSWLKDPEYGGDKAAESTELAKRAWDKLSDNELKTLADQTGWGDHPAVLRMLARAGRLFSEDTLIRGSVGAAPKQKSPEEILYGATTPADEPMS